MFGLGKKNEPADVRAMLSEASVDFGGAALSQRALHFFDNRGEYESWDGHSTGEPLWASDGYEPAEAEIAADILRELLRAEGRTGFIDWNDGVESVLGVFGALLERAAAPPIDSVRRESLINAYADVERGGATGKLMTSMDDEAAARGLAIHWWDTGGDSHMPHLMTPEVRERWRHRRFGKGYPVLP